LEPYKCFGQSRNEYKKVFKYSAIGKIRIPPEKEFVNDKYNRKQKKVFEYLLK
jgi:hypothetical protein